MVSILPLHHRIKGSLKRKVFPRCGRKKAQSDLVNFFLFLPLWICITCLFRFLVLSQSSLCFIFLKLFCLFVFSFALFCFSLKINFLKSCFVYFVTYVPWIAIEIKFFKPCIFRSLNEHLNAQLIK